MVVFLCTSPKSIAWFCVFNQSFKTSSLLLDSVMDLNRICWLYHKILASNEIQPQCEAELSRTSNKCQDSCNLVKIFKLKDFFEVCVWQQAVYIVRCRRLKKRCTYWGEFSELQQSNKKRYFHLGQQLLVFPFYNEQVNPHLCFTYIWKTLALVTFRKAVTSSTVGDFQKTPAACPPL